MRSWSRLLNYVFSVRYGHGHGLGIPQPTTTHTTASTRFFISKLWLEFKTGSIIDCVLPVVFPAFCDNVDRTHSVTVLTDGLIVYSMPSFSSSADRTVKYREPHSLLCSHNRPQRVRFYSKLGLSQVKGRVACQSPSFSQNLRTTIL